MKKIIVSLIIFSSVLAFTINCNANETNDNDSDTRVCGDNDASLDVQHMSPMYSVEELKNIFAALPYGENEQCIPIQQGNKVLIPHVDIENLSRPDNKYMTYILNAYDSKFDIQRERIDGYEYTLNVYVPKVWYEDIDKNPNANDTISIIYKQYLNEIQKKVLDCMLGIRYEKPTVTLKVYNEDNHKELLTTAKFPQDGKVTQKLLMGKKSKIVDRSTEKSTVLDGVASVKQTNLQKENKNNLNYRSTVYKDTKSNINIEMNTYMGSDFSANYDYKGVSQMGMAAGVDSSKFVNKYEDVSKSYKKLKKKFDKEAKKQNIQLVNTSKVKVNKYYVAYQNKYKMPNGEYKLEYNMVFNRDADQVTNKGELFSKLTISIQGNEQYIKEHQKEFNKVKKSIKLFKNNKE